MVYVDRHNACLEASDQHVRIQVVVHDECNPVLTTFPALKRLAGRVNAESLVAEVASQSVGSTYRLSEGAAPVSAGGHHAVGNDIGDSVEHCPDGPFAHGPGRLGCHCGFDAQKI